MSKLVILDLYPIGVEDAVQVFIEIGDEGKICERRSSGRLEADQRLWQAFKDWQVQYRSLARPYRAIKAGQTHTHEASTLRR